MIRTIKLVTLAMTIGLLSVWAVDSTRFIRPFPQPTEPRNDMIAAVENGGHLTPLEWLRAETDQRLVDEDWLLRNYGEPVHRCRTCTPTWEVKMRPEANPVFVAVYPDGRVVAWQRHRIWEAPSRGVVVSSVRIGGQQ